MSRYAVLVHGEAGAYGVAVPDCPGCTAMGATIDEAMANAAVALAEWMGDRIATGLAPPPPLPLEALRADPALAEAMTGSALGLVPLLVNSGRPGRVDLALDASVLAEIDAAARVLGLSRSAFLVSAARDKIAAGI